MMRRQVEAALLTAVAILGLSCARESTSRAAQEEPESWAVTAWGELYELFPEIDPLVDGEISPAHTHVTILDGFQPLTKGVVEIVLTDARGEQVFRAAEPVRPGIFNVDVAPKGTGEYRLLFRIESAAGSEEIEGGRVRVGANEDPGGLVAAAQTQEMEGEPISFLKEQQWRTTFATEWVRAGSIRKAVGGLARVRAPAEGEVTLTAAVDGVLRARPWPHVGERVRQGATVVELVPRVAQGESLAALEAAAAALESEASSATARRRRLEELLAIEAASPRDLEDARTLETTLKARLDAARNDLESSRAARGGGGEAEGLAVRAPFSGAIAAVMASPGAAVAAGEPMARLVRTDEVWLEAELRPQDATAIAGGGVAGVLILNGGDSPRRLASDEVRVVAVAPEVDPAKGTVIVLFEIPGSPDLLIGTTLEVEVLLPGEQPGIVIPTTAIVDDGGISVVYLQLEGESFGRREIVVDERQGEVALVSGLTAGQRLVTTGGDSIRRATLLSSGEVEGHVH